MLLKDKNAIIYGASGSMGGAVARAFAKEGATVFCTGRTGSSINKLVVEINNSDGKAIAAVIDAMNEKEVNDHLDDVMQQSGGIDISFNATGINNKQGIVLTKMPLNEFIDPVEMTMRTQFITATAAARAMMKKKSGVILTLTATPGGVGHPMVGGFGPACAALENFSMHLAVELGVYGIRVVNIRSGGSPDSRPFREAMETNPEVMDVVLGKMRADTMLKRQPLMADIANIAVFLASDMAATITGVTIDATAGTTAGINYRTSEKDFKTK